MIRGAGSFLRKRLKRSICPGLSKDNTGKLQSRIIKMRTGRKPGAEKKSENSIAASFKLKLNGFAFSVVLLILIATSVGCASLHKHKHLRNIPCPCENQYKRTLK
jgi:hypothetical protein